MSIDTTPTQNGTESTDTITDLRDLRVGDRVVDTSRFGYESTRWDREIRQYRDEEADADVWKLRGRNGWVAFDPSPNVKIEA